LPELPVQSADYAVWYREWLQGEALERLLAYWRQRLAGAPAALELPTDRPRPALQTYRGARRLLRLPESLRRELEALSRKEGVTLFMSFLAAFQALLARCTGQRDLNVGSPVANRDRVEVEKLIGFFVNTLVLRGDLSGDPDFRQLLGRVREVTLGAYAHQALPFEILVRELDPERDPSRSPLFQVALVLQNSPMPLLEASGLRLEAVELAGGDGAKFDLLLSLTEHAGELAGTLEYSTDLFDETTIARLAHRYRLLLEAVTAEPETKLSDLPLFDAQERHQILVAWNEVPPARDQGLLHHLFQEQAARSPEATALVAGTERVTYAELQRRSRGLARRLRALGVGPEIRVGLCTGRSMGLVVGLLGILEAGGAYVPLDPHYPRERLAVMLEDSAARLLVVEEGLEPALPEAGAPRVPLDREGLRFAGEAGEIPGLEPTPDNLSYLIYTSGSTGRPKAVAICHRSAVALVHWAGTVFSGDELDGVLAATSICFDLSVFEIFVPLARGGKVVLAENALELPRLPAAREVVLVNTVPSVIADLVRSGGLPPSVRTVNLAGEPLPRSLADDIHALGTVERLLNLYGPSEDTTYSTWACIEPRDTARPSIGRGIDGTRVYLLDETLQPVPAGTPGELCLGGAGLARGYLGRPERTAERFVPDPFGGPGERLYRTGDLARHLSDGRLDLLGRTDHQVKVRGFRIELGEVEAALLSHPGVADAAVVARAARPGDVRLEAYVVPRGVARLEPEGLRTYLRQRLPDYMVPGSFTGMDSLPRTPNGKLDRRSLPAPDQGASGGGPGFVAPRTPVEEILAELWCDLLRLPRVSVEDRFFQLGGHSILASQLASRVSETFHVEIPVSLFLQNPTIADLDHFITQKQIETLDEQSLLGLLDHL
jgi:amino acid adenylation domain-containing protein